MDKLRLLKSLKLFSRVPEEQLIKLEEFLKPVTLADGEAIFHEGSPGDSLYFIAEGRVRIAKLLPREGAPSEPPLFKDLSILAPGDCFGEMALIESVTRSAEAIASGPTTLLRLGREDLDRWLAANPTLALGFFAQLVQVISGRLRRSSNELTLLFDLSQILLEQSSSARDLLSRVLDRIAPHLEGAWSAGAYAYNEFNDEMELAATHDDFASVPEASKSAAAEGRSGWLDEQTYVVSFPGPRRTLGCFLFRRSTPLSEEERTEIHRTLTTTARLISTAIENISFRAEESFRSRLKKVKTTEF
jgi:CRP-like cAMP-binding protein